MKFICFKNVNSIVMTKGFYFGAPVHYVITNERHMYMLPATLGEKTDEQILHEGVYVNNADVSNLYLSKDENLKSWKMKVYRRLKKNINKDSVVKFISENYARFEI